ncbi:hypothetical protein SNOG_13558 [Parastagonospora nodorum SN15]|uniref:Uncharacterized protein n=1 Tax=Phaeosphaeria nodorum (strain SN15 / ATCC MYA-4574 / FGSC 10173) TaxID=321614 RepID=Q0U3V6_PHANO|nr:hypothetical protein SNOG_13558 [Parastagonospora nodorum SN15]EAT79005.1 hypothetical protein SNOG_13558 [Parastagonospora nodorum SN15]
MADVIGSANRGDLVSNARPSAIRFKSRWSSTPYGGRIGLDTQLPGRRLQGQAAVRS